MSKLLAGEQFNEKLYNTLPPVYHNADSMVDFALKRYLNVLSDGGFSKVIEEVNGILDLNDPEKTPKEVLSVVFSQYGLEIFNGLPELYLRKLLPILGDLYARKGATTVIEYLTSIISDVKSEVIISPDFLEDYHIDIKLEMDYDQQGARDIPDREQLLRIIKEFLPFFINVTIIFSYLFYELARLKTKDEEMIYVTDVRNEEARVVSQKGEGFFPTINNFELGLNSSIILSESYYYDVDVDWFTDKIINHFLEQGNMDSRKSHQYLRPTLNDPFMELNDDLFLSEYMDTDELVSTTITTSPVDDLVRVRVFENIIEKAYDNLKESGTFYSIGVPEDDSSLFAYNVLGNAIFGKEGFKWFTDSYTDTIKEIKEESGSICSDITKTYRPVLNNPDFLLNQRFSFNIETRADDFEDYAVENLKEEIGVISSVEEDEESITTTQSIEVSGSIPRIALPTPGTSRFMQAVFGDAVFDKDSEGIAEEFSDTISYTEKEVAQLNRQFPKNWSESLNTKDSLNDSLITNEFEELDNVEDFITHSVEESAKVEKTGDKETLKQTVGLFMYYPCLNTGNVLNQGLMTNISNSDVGLVLIEEMVYDKVIRNGVVTTIHY